MTEIDETHKNIRKLLANEDASLRKQGLELFRMQDEKVCAAIFKGSKLFSSRDFSWHWQHGASADSNWQRSNKSSFWGLEAYGSMVIPFCPEPTSEVLEAFLLGPDGDAGTKWRKKKAIAQLTTLSLTHCQVDSLLWVGKLPQLKQLIISHCKNLQSLDGIQNLKELELLHVEECASLTTIAPSEIPSSLRKLSVHQTSVTDTNFLSEDDSIAELRLGYDISALGGLANKKNLTHLSLRGAGYSGQLFDIAPISKLVNLTHLDVRDQGFESPKPLAQLGNLEELYLRSCEIGVTWSKTELKSRADVEAFQAAISIDDPRVEKYRACFDAVASRPDDDDKIKAAEEAVEDLCNGDAEVFHQVFNGTQVKADGVSFQFDSTPYAVWAYFRGPKSAGETWRETVRTEQIKSFFFWNSWSSTMLDRIAPYFTGLKQAKFFNADLTSLESWAGVPLESLEARSFNFPMEDLKYVPNLTTLNLEDVAFEEGDSRHLVFCPNLEHLSLTGSSRGGSIASQGYAYQYGLKSLDGVDKLTKLKSLSINFNCDMRAVAELPELAYINLYGLDPTPPAIRKIMDSREHVVAYQKKILRWLDNQ